MFTWDFDFKHNPISNFRVLWMGDRVSSGIAGITNKTWTDSRLLSTDIKSITNIYGNIQENLGQHFYKLDSYNCHTWVNNRTSLRMDNFQ